MGCHLARRFTLVRVRCHLHGVQEWAARDGERNRDLLIGADASEEVAARRVDDLNRNPVEAYDWITQEIR